MLDVFRIADLLVAHAVRTYGAEVSLIACYGSHGTGEARPDSDLDIFYTPVEGTDPPLARAFIVAGVPVDFWPIRWETLEGFATGRVRESAVAPGLVRGARLLYARSDEERARFEALHRRIAELQQPEAREEMVRRAVDAFGQAPSHLGGIRLAHADGDFTGVRLAGWRVVTACVECLALASQTTFARGWGHLREHLAALPLKPAGIEDLVAAVATSSDPARVLAAAEELAVRTRRILCEQEAVFLSPNPVGEVFHSAYPELREHLNKVLAACGRGDPIAASYEAAFVQEEIVSMLAATRSAAAAISWYGHAEGACLYRELGFPDLSRLASGDLEELAAQTALLDACLQSWLQANQVSLHTFATLEAFERSLVG